MLAGARALRARGRQGRGGLYPLVRLNAQDGAHNVSHAGIMLYAALRPRIPTKSTLVRLKGRGSHSSASHQWSFAGE